jgi:hypothetical protein
MSYICCHRPHWSCDNPAHHAGRSLGEFYCDAHKDEVAGWVALDKEIRDLTEEESAAVFRPGVQILVNGGPQDRRLLLLGDTTPDGVNEPDRGTPGAFTSRTWVWAYRVLLTPEQLKE